MISIKSPINQSNNLTPLFDCLDNTVSRETFSILKDEKAELLITSPRPEDDELNKYYESEDYISHTDSKKSIIDKVYQRAKNYAIKKKVKLINKISNNIQLRSLSILDVGCGTGDFLVACKNKKWSVVGIEPNKNARVLAKSKLGVLNSNSLNYNDKRPKIYNEIKNIEIDQKFNVITLWHVLEHVPNLNEYISLLKEQLKPNGTLIIAVPNFKSYDAKYYGKFWAAYDVPRHLWHFSKKSIKLLFKNKQLKVVKTIPMKLDSFYVSLLSEKYKTGKSNFIKSFLIGLKSNLKAKKSKEYSSLIYIIKNE